MRVNDRVLMKLKGQDEPYCIVRLVSIANFPQRTAFFFSLDGRHAEGEPIQYWLDRHEIRITTKRASSTKIEAYFDAPQEVELRPLSRRESVHA